MFGLLACGWFLKGEFLTFVRKVRARGGARFVPQADGGMPEMQCSRTKNGVSARRCAPAIDALRAKS